jgi:hypothetical protein
MVGIFTFGATESSELFVIPSRLFRRKGPRLLSLNGFEGWRANVSSQAGGLIGQQPSVEVETKAAFRILSGANRLI